MDILRDIAELVRDDREHNIEVKIDSLGLTVYLECDPDRDCEQNSVIPVYYDAMYESACIPQYELVERFKPNEGGIELGEIVLIEKILKYMEEHAADISELCLAYDLSNRHQKEEK